jgi:hypothetical protein
VIGGGLGDIEEVLAAGRRLAGAGYPVFLFRKPGRPLPRSVDGPWDWPRHHRIERLRPRGRAALTVTPCFGVSAAPRQRGSLGRAGPWAEEAEEVERTYGPARTVHVSLEEFARTLTSLEESRERLREGGVRARALARRLNDARAAGEVDTFRSAFRRFRAFDRANVLHLYATFRPDRAFAREFPEAVQVGPLWSGEPSRSTLRRPRSREWVWYASPSSAERIASAVDRGLRSTRSPIRLYIRSPRPWTTPPFDRDGRVVTAPLSPRAWRNRFRRAELRIVTGSRTLLEALELGGPFLYFNGVLDSGARARRHRPEKLRALLEFARTRGLPHDVRRDLADFSGGRRVEEIVRRAAMQVGGWKDFRIRRTGLPFRAPYDDLGRLLTDVASALAAGRQDAGEVVRRVRQGLHP